MESTGYRIKKKREETGYTQEELARIVNKSKQVISNWERGYSNPVDDDIISLSNALDVTSDYLLGVEQKEGGNKSETTLDEERKRLTNIIVNIKDPEKKKQAIAYLEYLASSPTDGAKE